MEDRAARGGDGEAFIPEEMVVTQPVARSSDPWTSWAAARSVTGQGKVQAEVLYVFRNDGPMTQQDMIRAVMHRFGPAHTESGIRSRCRELVDAGLVEDSGETIKLASGRKAKIWRAVPASAQGRLDV